MIHWLQCTMHTYVFFSFRLRAVWHIVQPPDCHIIQDIFNPSLSVERNNEKIRFPWVSNSKFVIFPQIYPCSNYKIFPNVPLLFPVSNGDSPVVTTFPRSNYRGFLTTGESYCTMYTLCSGKVGQPVARRRRRILLVILSTAAMHNAYIEQLDSSVYNIELYMILSYLL